MEGRLPMQQSNSSPTTPSLHSPTSLDEKQLYRKSSIASSRSSHSHHHRTSSTSTDEESLLAKGLTSPTKIPPLRAMRSSHSRQNSNVTSPEFPIGPKNQPITFDIPPNHTYKKHMIRGKWVSSRMRTICYMFMAAAAATTFGLVAAVYRMDYLPYKDAISTPRMFRQNSWEEQPADLLSQDIHRPGMRVRAYPPRTDLNGVYLIISFCGVGMFVFFGLWLQNIFRSARSYYVRFTKTEVFSLVALVFFGIGFGATAGYVTYTFKLDNDYTDFWSYTCSRKGTAQEIVYKSQIYYDGNCDMLTGAWATLLTLCAFSFIALLTFPLNIIYHNKYKNVGYSRFEDRIGAQADFEDRELRRAALKASVSPSRVPKFLRIFGRK